MKIHYSSPYSTEKNFGKAMNDFCALVPDGDWICIIDGDVLFLTPDWGKQIEEVVQLHGSNYSLFGCLTNRLARPIQRYNHEFCENHDIRYHYQIAEQQRAEHYAEVTDITRTRLVAGMFMLFPKKIWNKIKFEENTHHFDDRFSKEVVKQGGRLGLIQGLYVYHWYRGWSKTPIQNIGHLKATESNS